MSAANEILRRRERAMMKLELLLEQPSTVNVVHYACESFDSPNPETSPRISVIAVGTLDSVQTKTFSLDQEAELEQVTSADIASRLDDLERGMLCKFYNYVKLCENSRWLHWNMRDMTYGFNAIAHRYRVLEGEPVSIPDGLLFDLPKLLIDIFGERYASHTRMKTLFELNDLSHHDFLTGELEAKAYSEGQYKQISKSTQRKTAGFIAIAKKAQTGTLKTEIPWYKQYGLRVQSQLIIERVHSHWLFKLLVIASVFYSVLAFLIWLSRIPT